MKLTELTIRFTDKKCGRITCSCKKTAPYEWEIDFRSQLNYKGFGYVFSPLRVVSPSSLKRIIKKNDNGKIYKELLNES